MSFRQNPVEKKSEYRLPYSDRMQNIIDEYTAVNATYELSDAEKRYEMFLQRKEKFINNNSYVLDVTRVHRIQVPNSKTEYYTYNVYEEIQDDNFKVYKVNNKFGIHSTPLAAIERNAYGEIEKIDINKWKVTYELPWNPDEVRKLLESSRTPCTQFAVCKGNLFGRTAMISETRTVFNQEDLLNYKFEDLWNANKLGYLSETSAGIDSYLAVKGTALIDHFKGTSTTTQPQHQPRSKEE
jgi:hypothetical protein